MVATVVDAVVVPVVPVVVPVAPVVLPRVVARTTLPRTGSSSRRMIALALGLVAVGIGFVELQRYVTRRR
jgi:hypothetical protein